MDKGTKEKKLTAKQYEKLAEWGERAALIGLGSLVVQQIVDGASLASFSVITGAIVSALAYYQAYRWLKKAAERESLTYTLWTAFSSSTLL